MSTTQPQFDFDGATYVREHDQSRLGGQLHRVSQLMKDGCWRTLQEIADQTGDMAQSISARLRDLRKTRFGGHKIERRRRGDPANGLFEYRMVEE